MTSTTKKTLWIIGIIVVLIGGYAYLSRDGGMLDGNATSTDNGSDVVACTMDARMCPDGSYVGRSGPKCEFTACPAAQTSTSTTSVSGNGNGGVQYPADWGK